MHPLTTFEVHRQEQADLLRRAALLRERERVAGPRDDARGRPPDPRRARPRPRASVAASWSPAAWHVAP
ncbi:hypothetical protein [Cellulomonas phragmiteti]|uniref:Uncharacterized protein n=1 Tax=Cellulomonas phragmiteti TaxID=478780 RepID=A0ABQ4DHC1_9CELL|nr:hypothetical protein [Cellulomonas phragmiteti]GIG38316.1 hypothetical protein Cph01nite_00780 [Cellulomonas phragmiteti]